MIALFEVLLILMLLTYLLITSFGKNLQNDRKPIKNLYLFIGILSSSRYPLLFSLFLLAYLLS